MWGRGRSLGRHAWHLISNRLLNVPNLVCFHSLDKLFSRDGFASLEHVSLSDNLFVSSIYYIKPYMPRTSILSFGVTRTGDIVAKPLSLRIPKKEPNLSQVFSSLIFKDFKQILICRVNNICIGLKILYLDNTIEILGNWLPTSEWICIYDGGKLDFGWIGLK